MSTRGRAQKTISLIRTIAERFYAVEFADDIPLSERVLYPAMGAEAAGMEDARFVRFVDDDGSVRFYATYTAYDGSLISQQLLETTDFRSFASTPMVGNAAANKGLALFPRRIGGRFAACRGQIVNRIRLPFLMIRSTGRAPCPVSSPLEHGRHCSSVTAARPSKPRPAGWCSPTASARCAPTGSA